MKRPQSIALAVVLLFLGWGPALAGAGATSLDEATAKRGEVYARFMRAQLDQRRGEYRSAAAEIRQAVELMPDSTEVLIEAGHLLHRMGRLQDAEELGRRALALAPDDAAALLFVADLVAARALRPGRDDAKSRDEALDLYGRLLDGGSGDAEVMRKVISLRLQADDREGALAAARTLVERRPGDRHAAGLLAQLLLESGDHRGALRVLLDFIARHPGDSPLIRLAEDLARELQAWDLVEEVFAAHDAELDDRAVEAHRLRGEALLQLDRIEPASRALEKVLRSDPTDRAVRHTLARTYGRMGRLGEAAAMLRELADEAPGDRGTHLMLAEVLEQQNDVEGGLNAFNTALRLFSTEPEEAHTLDVREAIRRRMALLYLANDQIELATRTLAELERPESAEAYQVRARVAVVAEDWSAARQAARRLRALGKVGLASLIEGESLLRGGRGARAEPRFAEAIEALGPLTRVRIADLYLDSGMAEKGERLLRSWVESAPDDAEARFHMGSFLYRSDRFAESERELRDAFRLDPEHSAALNFLGYSLAERGARLDEALGLIERALAVDAWNGAYLDSLGWVYYQMGRYAEARPPLEQAARTYPNDPVVLEHLGDVYLQVGERQLAVAAWNRALAAGAEDPEALRAKLDVIEVAEQEGEGVAEPSTDAGAAEGRAEPRRRR